MRDKLILPRGLVIATRQKAGTVALTVRCADDRPESRPKYWQVQGSSNVPFVAGRAGLPLLLVESALDAALVWQESFGKLAAVALMTASAIFRFLKISAAYLPAGTTLGSPTAMDF